MRTVRADNKTVAKQWAMGIPSNNHNGTFKTDGLDLYSYNLLIGFTTHSGKKILLDYTASSGHFVSQTTSSKHISPSRVHADTIMSPSVLEGTDILESRKCGHLSSMID